MIASRHGAHFVTYRAETYYYARTAVTTAAFHAAPPCSGVTEIIHTAAQSATASPSRAHTLPWAIFLFAQVLSARFARDTASTPGILHNRLLAGFSPLADAEIQADADGRHNSGQLHAGRHAFSPFPAPRLLSSMRART